VLGTMRCVPIGESKERYLYACFSDSDSRLVEWLLLGATKIEVYVR
jgi:hypothetical protein